ncbi:RNA-binding family protein isoform 2 [Theobroma cacao]|uniref:RNA-binding family protein isoform 2 n=1 Tax=Theobroma cacao TaxID=3641 RepID=A0A061DLK9_THECC|nr:RNA-binding family protein isoform 2 [Theobroma cacao]
MKKSLMRFIAARASTIVDSRTYSSWRFYCSPTSSSTRPPPNGKLFVAGLSWSVDEKSLKDAFSSFGHVSEGQEALGLFIFLKKMKPDVLKMLWMERRC